MNIQQNQKRKNQLQQRLQDHSWNNRRDTYQQILFLIKEMQNSTDPFYLNGQAFNVRSLIPYLQDLADEDHPGVLLAGLDCVQQLLLKEFCTAKQFHKLIDQGLDKFPLRSSKRKEIVEKFADIILCSGIQPNVLNHKLNHPNEKCIMFVLEIVGFLGYRQLSKKIKKISEQHSKQGVRELAAEIYTELTEQIEEEKEPEVCEVVNYNQSQVKKRKPTQSQKSNKRLDVVEKLPQYEQLGSKQQQEYSGLLLNIIEHIDDYPQNQLTSLSYMIKIMIEDNNLIVSNNGIKMLKVLVESDSPLLPRSYPLFFIFQKFKLRPTHPVNLILYELTDTLLNSHRATDLFLALAEGGSNTKANIKYGCSIVFVRCVILLSEDEELFGEFCQGDFHSIRIDDAQSNKKKYQKLISKCYDSLSGDKKNGQMIGKVKRCIFNNWGQTTTGKSVTNTHSQKTLSSIKPKIQTNRKSDFNKTKSSAFSQKKQEKKEEHEYKIINPEDKIKKILIFAEEKKKNKLQTLIQESLKECEKCVEESRFQLYYFCQLIDSFITDYLPNDETSDIISQFLINYFTIVSRQKRKVKDNETVKFLLQICLCRLAIGLKINQILDNLSLSTQTSSIIFGLKGLVGKIKKKNRKYLLQWLDQNVSSDFMDSSFLQMMEKVQNGKQINKKKKVQKNQQNFEKQQKLSLKNLKQNQSKEWVSMKYEKFQQKEREVQTQKHEQHDKFPIHALDSGEISKIDYQQEKSQYDNLDAKWEYFLERHQQQSQRNHEEQHIEKKQESIEEKQQEEEYEDKIDQYKDFIKNIREKYLPSNYLQSNGKEENEYKEEEREQVSVEKENIEEQQKMEIYQQSNKKSEIRQQSQEEEQEQEKVQPKYSLLDERKLNYMLKNASNPYPHLRTQILIPFKNQSNKKLFLSQFIEFLKTYQISTPETYNGILLTVILLFAEIRGDKSLIGPLQELYEFLASLHTTNDFLKTIISLFHNVIEETPSQMRSFLITILTKSVSRLMPFVENPVELLRDLSQFYNIGENVYFDMYEEQYNKIKETIEGQALFEVVEKALIQEGEHLIVVVEGWFETAMKKKTQQYIEEIIQENEEN